jgi:hypothetical protein
MEQQDLSSLVAELVQSGRITAEDVLRLRRNIYGVRLIIPAHIEALFELDRACSSKAPEWTDLFAETLATYLIDQQEPYGYIDEANADWLIGRMMRDGRIDAATELDALITLLEKSKKSPERLVRIALEAVRDTVLNGTGPARRGGDYTPGVVTEADVNLIRRVLFAFGGDQNIVVSRAEAEILFEIDEATAQTDNDPSWSDLFIKAVANCVLFYSGYTVPTRQEAMRREQWLNEPASTGSFFSRMVGGLSCAFSGYGAPGSHTGDDHTNRRQAELAEARQVTEDEARWLAARIDRDHQVTDNEKALLAFLKEKSISIHPAFQPALDKLALAASGSGRFITRSGSAQER